MRVRVRWWEIVAACVLGTVCGLVVHGWQVWVVVACLGAVYALGYVGALADGGES